MTDAKEYDKIIRSSLPESQVAKFYQSEKERTHRAALTAQEEASLDSVTLRILKEQGVDPVVFAEFERKRLAGLGR